MFCLFRQTFIAFPRLKAKHFSFTQKVKRQLLNIIKDDLKAAVDVR